MTSYRIEKLRCPVTVMFASGEVVAGDVFLSATSRFGPVPQAPWDFFNEPDPYFPLVPADGRTVLAAKDHVLWAELPQPSTIADDGAGHPVAVEVTLSSGPALAGDVLVEAPTGHARLLDYLNASRERFLCLVKPESLTLVNRRAIVHVHELS